MDLGEGSEISTEDFYYKDSEEESSSDEEADDGVNDKEVAGAAVAYPYLGQPFVTKSVVSTIDRNLLRGLCKEMYLLKMECIALRSNDTSKSLQHILFENPVTFSTVAGKC